MWRHSDGLRRRSCFVGLSVEDGPRCKQTSASGGLSRETRSKPPCGCDPAEDGLRALANELTEWAQRAQIHPQWQLNKVDEPHPSHYRNGKDFFAVQQWFPVPPTLRNQTMENLGACLASGELSRLRICVDTACQRYF